MGQQNIWERCALNGVFASRSETNKHQSGEQWHQSKVRTLQHFLISTFGLFTLCIEEELWLLLAFVLQLLLTITILSLFGHHPSSPLLARVFAYHRAPCTCTSICRQSTEWQCRSARAALYCCILSSFKCINYIDALLKKVYGCININCKQK